MFKVYKLELNNKSYIGFSSRTIPQRIHAHWYEAHNWVKHGKRSTKWHRAILKYGIENVSWEVLEEFETKAAACEAEKRLIKEYNSIAEGYNTSEGGIGGRTKTPEQLEKLRQQFLTNNPSKNPETVKRMQASKKKYYASDEFKEYVIKDSERKRIAFSGKNNPNYGKAMTLERKQKMIASKKKRYDSLTPEQRSKFKYVVTSPQGEVFTLYGFPEFKRFAKEREMGTSVFAVKIFKGIPSTKGNSVGWTGQMISC